MLQFNILLVYKEIVLVEFRHTFFVANINIHILTIL